ncbi:hypothetical protein RB195_003826 [Necator americanus]|uniref:G-protein coupled receptors family 1 profile domain-containing protein n=1 Tax=Necator americanus TaxID=51031 RepID=A0ABR1DQK6_NECAM
MNVTPLSLRCYPEEKMLLMTEMDKRINQFVFPIQFLVAVIGNSLTMSVLLSSHTKNRANHLLAFLALCDILVFVMMLPHYLASLDIFANNTQFRYVHFHTKVHFGALSNWFSAAAIWFVLAVSVERLLIIKFPFRSLENYSSPQITLASLGILIGTLLLTSYHHVSHTCLTWLVCAGEQLIGLCYSNALEKWGRRENPTSAFTRQWIEASVFLNAVFAVLLPVFAVALLNISLIKLLKKRNSEELLLNSVNTNPEAIHEQERKMTHTVLAIVTCFSCTQGPSAIVFMYQILYGSTSTLQIASVVANQLVLTGKMLNIVLFCMTSSTFRRKLLQTCTDWICTLIHCDRKHNHRSHFTRSQSKSGMTQRTSLMYSWSPRGVRSSIVSQTSQKHIEDSVEMNATPLSLRCFSEDKMVLMTEMDKRINQLLFPIQFLVAVIGNSLTMSVLLSAHMKNRANHLLAFLALCDILVFVMMFPHYLAALDMFASNSQFRVVHFHTKVHFGALSNWFSAAAIWFVLAVSVERLLIIKFPFRSLDNYNSRQILLISLGILVATFVLTSYHHISHTCLTFEVCSGNQVIGICYENVRDKWGKRENPTSALTKHWIEASVYLNAVFAVLLPVFAVAVLNISLVRLLKKRNTQELLIHSVSANPSALQEQERKMTHTVLAIITCFSLTQGPSAIVYMVQKLYQPSSALQIASVVANQLVLTGKMLNVVLFCMTSSTFRRKLLQTCGRWMYTVLYCDRKAGNRYEKGPGSLALSPNQL